VSDADTGAALVAEACQRSTMLWVQAPGRRALPVWHAWHDGAVLLVAGGEEQPDPVADGATEVQVVVRSKAAQSRLVTFGAAVEVLDPSTPQWAEAAAALRGERLNARDPDTLLDRWAASSRVLRLVPTGDATEEPGRYDASSGALPPAPSSAVTVRRRPFHLGGRRRRPR
jgi:hypothetical protein